MGFFSKKKKEKDFFELIEEKAAAPAAYELPKAEEVKPHHPEHVLTTSEILSDFGNNVQVTETERASKGDALEALRNRMLKNIENKESGAAKEDGHEEKKKAEEKPSENKPKGAAQSTLLERCKPYIVDENGKSAVLPEEPLYKLVSVADILRSDSERAVEALAAKYDVTVDDLGRNPKETPKNEDNTVPQAEIKAEIKEEPKEEIKPVTPERVERNRVIFEEIVAGLNENEDNEVKVLSDIDNTNSGVSTASYDTATVRFTPVKENSAAGERISVSTMTRAVDLTGEFTELPAQNVEQTENVRLEETEFESYSSEEEYKHPNDAKRYIRLFSIRKRNAFLQMTATLFLVILFALFTVPALYNFILRQVTTGMIICAASAVVATAMNWDMFLSFRYIADRRLSADVMAAISALGTIILSVAACFTAENEFEIVFSGIIVLAARAVGKFLNASAKLSNFKKIALAGQKNAVVLLNDHATTFAMAKNAVDGDALIAVPRPTDMVDDFVKYSEYHTVLDGKMHWAALTAVALSVIIGLASGAYFASWMQGLFMASAVLNLAATPVLFLINTLPIYNAASRLNKKGAVISGVAAASHLEMANAVVLSSRDLFPEGTVTMHDVKVLSENNFDEIILRAASLTESVNSPLAPIFKRIAGTSDAYTIPDSDTVKYEERMGLSGWVNDELLFIGNRTLMQAHGIQVPDIEIDRNILRKGYFPVYIACGGKACAMVVVRYDVDPNTARELHRLMNIGVTLLIENCDQNMTEEMICDYLGLYPDSVRVMTNSGCHMYRNAVTPTERCTAPAAFKGNPLNLVSIINCASRIKASNFILTLLYVIAACVGIAAFVYFTFIGSFFKAESGTKILIFNLSVTLISYLLFLIKKP